MKDSAQKVCCPHCEYRTPVVREFSNGKTRDGRIAMKQHIQASHKEEAPQEPVEIEMTPEQEHAELMIWSGAWVR